MNITRNLGFLFVVILFLGSQAQANSPSKAGDSQGGFKCITSSSSGKNYFSENTERTYALLNSNIACMSAESTENCPVAGSCWNLANLSSGPFECHTHSAKDYSGFGLSPFDAQSAALAECLLQEGVNGIEACHANMVCGNR